MVTLAGWATRFWMPGGVPRKWETGFKTKEFREGMGVNYTAIWYSSVNFKAVRRGGAVRFWGLRGFFGVLGADFAPEMGKIMILGVLCEKKIESVTFVVA